MERRDVVVVGAGITGLAIAHRLVEDSAAHRIRVLDPLGVGEAATAVAPGGVRQQWSTTVNCRMARYACAFYRDAGRMLDEPRIRLARGGYLFLAHDDAAWASLRAAVAVQRGEGVPTELLTPWELHARFAFLAPDESLRGGSFLGEDGYLDNPRAVVYALWRRAEASGVEFRRAAVSALQTLGGRVTGVETADGPLAADVVIVAAGVDTPALLATAGIACPIAREPKHLLYSRPVAERFLEPLVIASSDGVAAKQLASGHVLAADLAGVDPAQAFAWRARIRAFGERALPQLAMLEFGSLSSGYYDSTPDHQGIVSATDVDGLIVAAGMSGHGFMMAPAVAATVASLLTGEACPWPLSPLSLGRFSGPSPEPERSVV